MTQSSWDPVTNRSKRQVQESTPLLPPYHTAIAPSYFPMEHSDPPGTNPNLVSKPSISQFKIRFDVVVLENQRKWRRLNELNEENSTAKDMAREVQHEFTLSCVKQPHSAPPVQSKADKDLIAASFIRDALHARKLGYRLDVPALYMHDLFHSSVYRLVYTIIGCISCSLAFFEKPTRAAGYIDYPFFWVDIICVFLFSLDVYIRWFVSSKTTKKRFISRQPWAYVRILMLCVTIMDIFAYIIVPQWNPYRFSRAFRPFFLITRRRNLRIIFGSCLRAVQKVLIVLLLLFCVLAFFGLVAFLLFSDLSDQVQAPYFASLSSSMYTVLLIHHSPPYLVQSMYPYYIQTEWSAVFFIIVVLLTNYFLAKLSIAVSYRSYRKYTEEMLFKRLQKRKAAMDAAFGVLSEDIDTQYTQRSGSLHRSNPPSRHLSLNNWIRVCGHLRPKWTEVEMTLIFNTIDVSQVGYLEQDDFYELCSFLSVQMEKNNDHNVNQLQFLSRWAIPFFGHHTRARVRSLLLYQINLFDKYPVVLAECIVGVIIALSIVQAVQVNNIELAFSVNKIWRSIGEALLWLFTAEIALKMYAFGRDFFHRPFCRLDFGIAFVGWIFYGITSFRDPPHISLIFYDLALAIRSLRVLKLLNLIHPFREILDTMHRIFPLMFQLFLVVFSVTYACGIFMQAFYGEALSQSFTKSMQSQAKAWFKVRSEFQMETFHETLVTLFNVATLSGWTMVMDAAHAITQSDRTIVFFFGFRILVSNILLPIVVGFLVESFTNNSKKNEVAKQTICSDMSPVKRSMSSPYGMDQYCEKIVTFKNELKTEESGNRDYRMKFERYASFVQAEMFEAVQNSDIKHLQSIVGAQESELFSQKRQIRELEKQIIELQTKIKAHETLIFDGKDVRV